MITHNPKRGITYMLAATVLLAIGWVGIKLVGKRLPTPEIVCLRALVGFLILLPIVRVRAKSMLGHNRRLLVLRSVVGLGGMMCGFYAMTHMNLGDASMLLNTFPLFVALLAPFFLKETSNPRVFLFAIIAFVGIGLILKPTSDIINSAALIGLASGVLVALAMIVLRKLRATDDSWVIALWFSAIITLGAAPFVFLDFIVPTAEEWLVIILAGSFLTVSQIFLTKAYGYADAQTIAPFAYCSVIWSYGFDILIWDYIPDVWSIVGSVIVIASSIFLMEVARRPRIRPGATY